jgi:transcriptional regulator GlxA family with amidase domain
MTTQRDVHLFVLDTLADWEPAFAIATFGLARAGLVDDRRHTSNDAGWLASSGYRGSALYVDDAAVEDRDVITASAMAPLELARLVLARLEVFSSEALEAWYQLYKTRQPQWYEAFTRALG